MILARFSDRREIEAIVGDAGSKRLGERHWPLENLSTGQVRNQEIAKLIWRERTKNRDLGCVGKVSQLVDADYRRNRHCRGDLREDQELKQRHDEKHRPRGRDSFQGSESSTRRFPNESMSNATALPFPAIAPRIVASAS